MGLRVPEKQAKTPIRPTGVRAFTLTTALGRGCDAHLDALLTMRSGLRPHSIEHVPVSTRVGEVAGLDLPLVGDCADFDCRNNRLAAAALAQDAFEGRVQLAAERLGPERIGVFVGTSTSGIRQTETCYHRYFRGGGGGLGDDLHFDHTHANYSLAAFCRHRLGLRGPALVISTACSSSAKTFAAAHRALAVGLCDAAVVGGADSLCETTLLGFHALGLLSGEQCAPWGKGRSGINIGEGAAFALLERDAEPGGPALLGFGESSDAYHMTRPHPDGAGAAAAMRAALAAAGIGPDQVDYLNLHGTGTPANDLSEDRAVASVFGQDLSVSATKGWTGHTLGACGAVEAALTLLTLEHGLVPATLGMFEPDPDLLLPVSPDNRRRRVNVALSNTFGFGGNNCSLVLGRT